MVKVTVIGHFGKGNVLLNGQTIKTKIITEELIKKYGSNEVEMYDTYGMKIKFLFLPFAILRILRNSRNVIIFPAQNGLRIIAPCLYYLNKFYQRSLHYCVIGGWLPSFLKNRNRLRTLLKKFDCIYVETSTMQRALLEEGFNNITVLPNCKKLRILKEDELVYPLQEPYKLCTFSRVMKKKGIDDAIEAVRRVNDANGRIIYTLDIYGQIEQNQIDWFEELERHFPNYVQYKGVIDYDKSVDTIKDYFALIFPTRFFTEGIPGTILDAYAAGVPVIAAKWESFNDIIKEGKTGIGYEFQNVNELVSILANFANHPEEILALKNNCLVESRHFSPDEVIKILELGGYSEF